MPLTETTGVPDQRRGMVPVLKRKGASVARKDPTISSILQELANEFDGIVAERTVYDRVLARRPSTAKNPDATIRTQLRYDAPRLGWVFLGAGELAPLRTVLIGLRFRLVPNAEELASGGIIRSTMRPFIPVAPADIEFEDAAGQTVAARQFSLRVGDGPFGPLVAPAYDLADWFASNAFGPGDSVLITIRQFVPLTLQIAHEQANAFRADGVANQERELVDGLVAAAAKVQHGPIFSEISVLPIYARAAWRTGYPGRPWQMLVGRDRRLRLLDDEMIADARYRSPLDIIAHADTLPESESMLLAEITRLQDELRTSRRTAAERGLWDGIAPRVSTAHTLFDFEEGTSTTIYPGAVDALADHSSAIEAHIENGDYVDEDSEPDPGDIFELEAAEYGFEEMDELDDLQSLADIGDMQAFVERNPELAEATRRLMQLLTPDEQQRLDRAETLDDVQQVLGPHLNDMFRTEPSLFVPLDPTMLSSTSGNGHANDNGNGHANGNGHKHDAEPDLLSNEGWVDEDLLFGTDELEFMEDEQPAIDSGPVLFGTESDIKAALERSGELMDQFVHYQLRQGKSAATAKSRAEDMWMYADFLSRYYGRSLAQGDYATLDECLFYFYPRKVMNSSPRQAREFCTSAKQFYAFLKAQRTVDDDAFATALWQRREQAARVVEIYDQIDGDSPQFERLFAYLFAPYTA